MPFYLEFKHLVHLLKTFYFFWQFSKCSKLLLYFITDHGGVSEVVQ